MKAWRFAGPFFLYAVLYGLIMAANNFIIVVNEAL